MLDALLKFVPKPLHPAYLGLLGQVPDYMTRIAVAGESCGAAGYLLKKRLGVNVLGAVANPRLAEVAGRILDGVIADPASAANLLDQSLDAILLCNLEEGLPDAMVWLDRLGPKLRTQGYVYVLFGEPAFARPGGWKLAELEAAITAELGLRGYGVYLRWPLVASDGPGDAPEAMLLAAVTGAYNPVLHADELRASARPAGAYHLLDQVPAPYLANPASREAVGMTKLAALGDWIRLVRGHDVSNLLGRALGEFYQLSDENPRNPEPYLAMAACWEGAGDTEMARRLLRTIAYSAPSEPVARMRAQLESRTVQRAPSAVPVPIWDGKRSFRVLYMIHPRPHYGLDVLYDGLCACLGDENVVDYPLKATLHGGETPEHRHYPCRFNRRGVPETLESICNALRSNAFDFILFADVEGDLPEAEVAAILAARGECPIFLMDGLDEMGNFRARVQQRLGIEFAGYFKREMHRCVDYGPQAWPMPFSYAGELGLQDPIAERTFDFFWAGHRRFGQRRLYLETLEGRYGWDLAAHFDQAAYQARIRASRIGLNCFGMGFDTVRYWELPAQGCMLLSDRLPITIPHNFEDGVHAVFFGDLGELMEKLDYYLHRPGEVATIAEAGRRHFQQYHTNRARAAQLLGRVETVLDSMGA